MFLEGKIENGQIVFKNETGAKKMIQKLEGKEVNIEIKRKRKRITDQQNRALHLWFTQLAEELNNAGLDIKKTLSQEIEHPWTPELIKEFMWRPTMKAYKQENSTTRLKTDDIDKIFEVINKFLGERFGLHVAFPSIETLMLEEEMKQNDSEY